MGFHSAPTTLRAHRLGQTNMDQSSAERDKRLKMGLVFESTHFRGAKIRPRLVPWLRFLSVLMVFAPWALIWTQTAPTATSNSRMEEACPRPLAGSIVGEPRDVTSKNGILALTLTVRSSSYSDGSTPGNIRYCYTDEQGDQAPTLHVQPGDTVAIRLKNKIAIPTLGSSAHSSSMPTKKSTRSCDGGVMNAASTNLHFHGLSLPPTCHQDETLKTVIQPGDSLFEYRFQIPESQPPGLYWYHPHVHGLTEEQLLGGASGALIVGGMQQAVPRVAGLPERVFVFRDERMPDPSDVERADLNRPTKQLSINYVPVRYPDYSTAVINMKPMEKQFWRVLNASADTYLDLMLLYEGKPQPLGLVALDGVPLHYGEVGAKDYAPQRYNVFLPPGSRAEFVLTGPPDGVSGLLVTNRVFRGASDDNVPLITRDKTQPALRLGLDDVDPRRPLATLIASTEASTPHSVDPTPIGAVESSAPLLSSVRPVRKRTLYFSEKLVHPEDPNSLTLFFITEEGHPPAMFDPHNSEPNITVHQGDVEDWTIENRSRESHVFHVHQLHFLVIGSQGVGYQEATLRDTVNLPAWDGFRRYPSVTLRMDFRDPRIVGTFPFHCHIMQHGDGGMMGTVRVDPATEGKGSR
jgi:FtsP/CotA-like multicopper oxidase with cupredoxin domain